MILEFGGACPVDDVFQAIQLMPPLVFMSLILVGSLGLVLGIWNLFIKKMPILYICLACVVILISVVIYHFVHGKNTILLVLQQAADEQKMAIYEQGMQELLVGVRLGGFFITIISILIALFLFIKSQLDASAGIDPNSAPST